MNVYQEFARIFSIPLSYISQDFVEEYTNRKLHVKPFLLGSQNRFFFSSVRISEETVGIFLKCPSLGQNKRRPVD